MKAATRDWSAKAEGDAVEFRYPGASATAGDARQALHDAKTVRKEARFALGL